MMEYERIVYMDSDLFPLVNTEELFELDLDQHSTSTPSYNYSFAAVPNLVGKNEQGWPIIGNGFNAGFFVMKPDTSIFERLWERAMDPEQSWNYHRDVEQGLLNEFYATGGQAPMFRLDWTWNVKDMPDEYMEESKVVHARFTLVCC
jgi:alpha-N-acetylglucosamine transferase